MRGIKRENIICLPFKWLHWFSLDAVGAGIVWQEIIFRHREQAGHWQYHVILGGAIWLAYVADRLFDLYSLNKGKLITARHAFILRYWRWFVILWLCLFPSMVIFSYHRLPTETFIGGIWIVVLINLYFLFLRVSKPLVTLGAIKELLTATLFAIGVSYFPILSSHTPSSGMLPYQAAFGLLCFTNVLLISHWEFAIDQEQAERKLSQRTSNRSALLLILLTLLVLLSLFWLFFNSGIFAGSLLCSTVLLGILFMLSRRKESFQDYTFLIDVPLIFPFLLFFVF